MIRKLLRIVLMWTAAAALMGGCASRAHLAQNPKLHVIVAPAQAAAPLCNTAPKNDSGRVEQTGGLQSVDSLIQNADAACDSEHWAASHALLGEAVSALHALEENGDGVESEDYYKEIADLYSERMPEAYADSVPEEVSLLAFQRQMSESLDSITISSADSIALQTMMNQKTASYDIPIVWNDRVYKALCFLSRGGKGPLDKWIARSNYYLPTIKRLFSDSGAPSDIAYLPLIESGFNPLAYSRKKAAGMWQFIPSTAKLYGLHKDCWIDERRDFIQSTKAAIAYLKKLYNQFNDWHLAIAAYNCGEKSMCRAMARSSAQNYWGLSRLPRETRNYIPEFLAALIVAKNPNYSGFSAMPSDTFDLDTVIVDRCLSLYTIADSLGISYEELRKENPHILHWCTHPRVAAALYLPKGKKELFANMYERSPSDFSVTWYGYRVKSGETLKAIARHFKVSMDAILSLNALTPSRRLSVGQQLSIPIPVNQFASRACVIRDRDERAKPPYRTTLVNGTRVIKYRVRGGDCLWSIAQLFRVDKRDLCKWNGIGDAGSLRAGSVLTMYKSPESLKAMFPAGADEITWTAVSKPAPATTDSSATDAGADSSATIKLSPAEAAKRPDSSVNVKTPAIAPDATLKHIVYYKVRKGDNLWNIAQSFNVPVRELTAINDIDVDTTLMPGVVLKVPLAEKL